MQQELINGNRKVKSFDTVFFSFSGNPGMCFSFFMPVGFADILRQPPSLFQTFVASVLWQSGRREEYVECCSRLNFN